MSLTRAEASGLVDAAPGLLLLVGQLMQRLELTEVTLDPDTIDDKVMGKLKVWRHGDLLTIERLLTEGEG